ncbi:hypothetical protein [Tortoise microvirus 26]|nr:hypothetical protein [Tortoise microvirus 26]
MPPILIYRRFFMEFRTSYSNRPVVTTEKSSPIDITERVGYISLTKQIQNLRLAGQKLVLSRAEQYDFSDFDFSKEEFYDSIGYDPTVKKSFDFAEAYALQQRLRDAAFKSPPKSQSTNTTQNLSTQEVNSASTQEQQPETPSTT